MNNVQNKGGALLSLRLIYFAILAGTVMFAGIIYFVSDDGNTEGAHEERNVLVIVLFVAAIALSVSSFLWRKDIGKIQQQSGSLTEKFEAYRAAAIKRYAIIEFAALLCIICYLISGEIRLYIAAAILIVYLLTLFPSPARIASQIGESAEDIARL
jgi:hypothetical protein